MRRQNNSAVCVGWRQSLGCVQQCLPCSHHENLVFLTTIKMCSVCGCRDMAPKKAVSVVVGGLSFSKFWAAPSSLNMMTCSSCRWNCIFASTPQMQWCNVLTHSLSPHRDKVTHGSHQLYLTSPGTDLDPSPDTLVQVPYTGDSTDNFKVNVCIVSQKDVWILWHNPCIIYRHINAPSGHLWDGRARHIFSSSSIHWVRVVWEAYALPQLFGVVFGALSVNHAWTVMIP